jgi:hypothetical protein
MCDLHVARSALRAYPSRPIDFELFEYFVRSIPGVDVGTLADEVEQERVLALRDDRTGIIEIVAVPLDSGNVGFQVHSSPSRRIQRQICERFGIEFVFDRADHHLEFICAETSNWAPHAVPASA